MRFSFVTLLLLIAAAGQGQTLTQSYHEPDIGDVDQNHRFDTSAYTSGLPTAVTGSNVSWDFTLLTSGFPIITDSIISPSAASGNTNYPGASFVQRRDIIYSYFKSSVSPQQTELIGAWSPSLVITFTNSALVATYPVSYGYSMTDPVSGTFKYNNTNGACNGSITVTAIGLGTLQFPGGVSYPNVLCLKSVEQLTMSVGIFPVGNIDQFIYSYYVPGKKYPAITIQYQKYQLLAGQPTITAQAYGNLSYFMGGVNDRAASVGTPVIRPHPFADHLSIQNAEGDKEFELQLFDLQGRCLFTGSGFTIPTGSLASGTYILSVRNQEGIWYRKVIRE